MFKSRLLGFSFVLAILVLSPIYAIGLEINHLSSLFFGGEMVSGGSSLFKLNDKFYAVSDNRNEIFEIVDGRISRALTVFPWKLPKNDKDLKKQKPDLESAVVLSADAYPPHGGVLLLPSGSKVNRFRGAIIGLDKSGNISSHIKLLDLFDLYRYLLKEKKIKKLNIEGVVAFENQLLLFHRGNSRKSTNAIISLNQKCFLQNGSSVIRPDCFESFVTVDLGKEKNVPYTFTEAILVENKLIFLAAAEETESALEDGDVSGSIIGQVNTDGEVIWTKKISNHNKFEGMVLKDKKSFSKESLLLLLSDPDDLHRSSEIFSLEVEL